MSGVPKSEAGPRRFRPYPEYRESGQPWLGKVPCSWDLKPLWTMFRRIKRTGYPDAELLSVYRDYGVIPKASRDDNWNKASEDLSAYQLVEAGDLVTNKMKTWQGSIAISLHNGIVSPAYHVYTPNHSQVGRYIHHLLRSPAYVSGYLQMSKGIRVNQWDLEPEAFSRMQLLLPSPSEQTAIAEFLDRETGNIDALLAKKERLIELLEEKREAVITHAVTQGLAPTAATTPSSIDWFGDIPSHWQVLQLRRVIRKFVDYRGKTPQKTKSGVRLVTARNIKKQTIDFSQSEEFIPESLYEAWMVRGFPEVGDVVVTTEAPLGGSAQILDTDIALAQRIILLKANKARVTNDYLKYHFASQAGQAELWTRSTGSTAKGIKASHLKATLLALPPLDEQRDIAAAVGSECAGIDSLIAKVQEAVVRLKEFRTALISAAVTGKIDVREKCPV